MARTPRGSPRTTICARLSKARSRLPRMRLRPLSRLRRRTSTRARPILGMMSPEPRRGRRIKSGGRLRITSGLRPPASWRKETHGLWATLDPAIQDEVLKREKDFERGLQEKTARYKPFEELEPLLEPRRQQWQLRGLSAPQALQQLFAAQDFLERDPRAGLAWLAQAYGIHPQALLQLQGHPGSPRGNPPTTPGL